MRSLRGAMFLSLDGIMQAPGGPDEDPTGGFPFGGWVAPFWDGSLSAAAAGVYGGDYDLLLGRRTYDIFAAYWPYNRDDPIGARFQAIDKHVVSSSEGPLEWENSHRLHGPLDESVAALKAGKGHDLLIQGSSSLYPALLAAGLIDRMTLMIFPVLLGRGKRPFARHGAAAGAMRLIEHSVSEKGVILATYEPAGEVRGGTFATRSPSAAELERRRKIAEGSW